MNMNWPGWSGQSRDQEWKSLGVAPIFPHLEAAVKISKSLYSNTTVCQISASMTHEYGVA